MTKHAAQKQIYFIRSSTCSRTNIDKLERFGIEEDSRKKGEMRGREVPVATAALAKFAQSNWTPSTLPPYIIYL